MTTTTTVDATTKAIEEIAPAIASVIPRSPIAPLLAFIGRNVREHPLWSALVGAGAVLLVIAHHRERQRANNRAAYD